LSKWIIYDLYQPVSKPLLSSHIFTGSQVVGRHGVKA
jgi:hypothetical protein